MKPTVPSDREASGRWLSCVWPLHTKIADTMKRRPATTWMAARPAQILP
jgi:hypothetical protein